VFKISIFSELTLAHFFVISDWHSFFQQDLVTKSQILITDITIVQYQFILIRYFGNEITICLGGLTHTGSFVTANLQHIVQDESIDVFDAVHIKLTLCKLK